MPLLCQFLPEREFPSGGLAARHARRRLIELEIAHMEHVACRRTIEYAHSIRDRMVHREEFRLDASKVDRLPWLDLAEFRVLDLVLLELAFDKAERELGRIDRYLLAQILQKIRQSAV